MEIKELIEKRSKQYGNLSSYYKGFKIRITPSKWYDYCVTWYKGDNTLLVHISSVTAEQAAREIEQFEEWVERYIADTKPHNPLKQKTTPIKKYRRQNK